MAVTIDGSANTITAQATIALGNNQTWQDLTASRVMGTTYTNSTGEPIFVSVYVVTSTAAGTVSWLIGGVEVGRQGISAGASCTCRVNVSFIVPNGVTYSATNTSGSLANWSELR